MLAPRILEKRFHAWNSHWGAPFGRCGFKKLIPRRLWEKPGFCRLVGMFCLQPNCETRRFEYPWAFFVSSLQKGMRVVDIGGGYSGFPFVLSKYGCDVVNVDPLVDYGPLKHYSGDHLKKYSHLNKIFGTNAVLKNTTIFEAQLPIASVDRIFCISVIEHLNAESRKEVMGECCRILKPGGLFIRVYTVSSG